MEIRHCSWSDCERVLELWRVAEAIPSASDTIESVQRCVEVAGDLFLVAEDEGKLVGSIIGGWDGWRGNIYRLAVHPAYRRKGLGKELITEVEQRLKNKGVRRITALVAASEEPAMAFWPAAGYKLDSRMVRFVKSF